MNGSFVRSKDATGLFAAGVFGLLAGLLAVGGCAAKQTAEEGAPASVEQRDVPASASAAERSDVATDRLPTDETDEEAPAGSAEEREAIEQHSNELEESEARPISSAGKGSELMGRLRQEEAGLARALQPAALSCQGADPRRDAICSIAERLCEDSQGLTSARERDCERARRACERARSRYEDVCGE